VFVGQPTEIPASGQLEVSDSEAQAGDYQLSIVMDDVWGNQSTATAIITVE
jgi:hypothetical protein